MDASTGGAPLALSLSDDGLYAAHTNAKDLVVYSSPTSDCKEVQLARIKESGLKELKFYPARSSSLANNEGVERRLLSANESRISIWTLEPLQVLAEIENLDPGVLNIEFGADQNEILVFHAWNTKLNILSLCTGRSSVIKNPKFAHHLGFGYRPRTRHFAIILKPEASDLLTVHHPESYSLIGRAVLPTVDAQGLKWSPDGRWMAIWDVASAGTKVLIFTADAQLFKSYSTPSGVDDSFDLGVRQVEWSPATGQDGTSEVLAVGKINGNVDLLRTRTFSSFTTLSHILQTDQGSATIWRERYTSALGDAEYAETSSSSAFNMSPEASGPLRGVSIMTFSSNGDSLATVDTMRSNVVWIWDLSDIPRLASVLIHEQSVRQLTWHPSTPQLLINTATNTLPAVRWWSPQTRPVIARVPTKPSESGKYEVKWLAAPNEDSVFWYGSTNEYVVGYLTAEDATVKFELLNSVTNLGYGDHAGRLSR